MVLILLPLLLVVLGLVVYLAAGILLWLGERVLRGSWWSRLHRGND